MYVTCCSCNVSAYSPPGTSTDQPSTRMGRDERVEHDGYADQDPNDVARQTTDAASLFANVLSRLSARQRNRHVQLPSAVSSARCDGSPSTPSTKFDTTSSMSNAGSSESAQLQADRQIGTRRGAAELPGLRLTNSSLRHVDEPVSARRATERTHDMVKLSTRS